MKFAICTSLYKSGLSYLEDWQKGVLLASLNKDVIVIAALDKLKKQEVNFKLLKSKIPIFTYQAEKTSSPALVRQTMFQRASESNVDILVFCDMDDYLLPNSLSLHHEALKTADFSYGDMKILLDKEKMIKETFYSRSTVPKKTSQLEQLADRNWLGLSNTAIWKKIITPFIKLLSPETIAVDWWLYTTLLKNGYKGIITKDVVSVYRNHNNNIIGAYKVINEKSLLNTINIVKNHYEYFKNDLIISDRLKKLNKVIKKFKNNPSEQNKILKKLNNYSGVWYENIAYLLTNTSIPNEKKIIKNPKNYFAPSSISTLSSLQDDLYNLGIYQGDTVMIHTSMNEIGYVVGGASTIIDALNTSVGAKGTIMMPAFTGILTNPKNWFKPPIPEIYWDRIRSEMPAFNLKKSPCYGLGLLPEIFRNDNNTFRSNHPVSSFTARGFLAKKLIANHPLNQRFGPLSPLGALCEVNGKVALLGAPYESMSLLHLSSHLMKCDERIIQSSPILVRGKKVWVEFQDTIVSWRYFHDAINHLIDIGLAKVGKIGEAKGIILPAKEAVKEIIAWRNSNNK